MNRTIINLIPRIASADLKLALDHLRRAADNGEIMVLAWIAIGPGGNYEIDVAGEAQRDYAAVMRGFVPDLDEELRKLRDAK